MAETIRPNSKMQLSTSGSGVPITRAMLIRATTPNRIVVELDRPEVALAIERREDGLVLAGWVATRTRQLIRFVDVGKA
jgi:hypothetical protein